MQEDLPTAGPHFTRRFAATARLSAGNGNVGRRSLSAAGKDAGPHLPQGRDRWLLAFRIAGNG